MCYIYLPLGLRTSEKNNARLSQCVILFEISKKPSSQTNNPPVLKTIWKVSNYIRNVMIGAFSSVSFRLLWVGWRFSPVPRTKKEEINVTTEIREMGQCPVLLSLWRPLMPFASLLQHERGRRFFQERILTMGEGTTGIKLQPKSNIVSKYRSLMSWKYQLDIIETD